MAQAKMGLNRSPVWMPSWSTQNSHDPAKTVKQQQSSEKQVTEGSQVAFAFLFFLFFFLAAVLGEVFIDYAELSAQHQSNSKVPSWEPHQT